MTSRMGYKEALDWLFNNDDMSWLNDEYGSPSVSACLVADIYQGGDTDKVTRDLARKYLKKAEND